ncbi:hypothetical protein CDAR_474541 [Caerostris darwini]|uniref:Uncharacterized protein n=1 Tax=Caerostris darwini TaxID=1538125 RepID=A0AAV4PKT2_9ARAC|nr:hypothetical protein CDAR_474541 [Caerostris darwini]
MEEKRNGMDKDTHSNSDVRRTARTQRRHLLVKMESFRAVQTGNGIFAVDFGAFHSLEWDTSDCIFDSAEIIILVMGCLYFNVLSNLDERGRTVHKVLIPLSTESQQQQQPYPAPVKIV